MREKYEKWNFHKRDVSSRISKLPAFCQDCGFMFLPVQISSCLKPSTPMRATAWGQEPVWRHSSSWFTSFLSTFYEFTLHIVVPSTVILSAKNRKRASNSCCMQFRINRSTCQRRNSGMKSSKCPTVLMKQNELKASSSRNASTSRCASINLHHKSALQAGASQSAWIELKNPT